MRLVIHQAGALKLLALTVALGRVSINEAAAVAGRALCILAAGRHRAAGAGRAAWCLQRRVLE
jgi:hypothetical protein